MKKLLEILDFFIWRRTPKMTVQEARAMLRKPGSLLLRVPNLGHVEGVKSTLTKLLAKLDGQDQTPFALERRDGKLFLG